MALRICPDCRGQVKDQARVCPNCGRPTRARTGGSERERTKCPGCKKRVDPIVTSVGELSCSFGCRDKWTCLFCNKVIAGPTPTIDLRQASVHETVNNTAIYKKHFRNCFFITTKEE